MIQADNIEFSYNGGALLKDLSLRVKAGELHGIIGPNGVGKSTLLRIIAGLYKPQQGGVSVNGRPVTELPPPDRAKLLSFVFHSD